MNESTKEIKLDAVEEAVAALLKEPESIKLKEEMELAWESIPTFGLAPDASAEAVAEKATEIGEHAASIFPGIELPTTHGVKFMLEKAIELVSNLRDSIMFTQEIENAGQACAMYTDTNTMVRAIIMVMAVHMLISYTTLNKPDLVGEGEGKINAFRYFTVLSNVVSMKLLRLSKYSFISKEVLQQQVEDAKSKIILA
jgi:hypothetical protein